MAEGLGDYARAVPLNALTAYGFGPLARGRTKPATQLESMRWSTQGAWTAVETAGVIGRRLLQVLAALGGSASRAQLEFQTNTAVPGVLTDALGRLEAAELVVVRPDGGVELASAIRAHIPGATISMAEQNAITTDALALICRALGVKPPGKKQDRIDAIAATFADDRTWPWIRGDLSTDALALLDRIVAAAGPGTTSAESVGVARYSLRSVAAPRFAFQRAPELPDAAALQELTRRGIVGVAEWEQDLWVWREAWPFVDRPFYSDWATLPDPRVVPAGGSGSSLPAIVGALDQAMRAWQANPPATLKNGDARIGKVDVRATAKALAVDELVVDIGSRLAISIGLLLPNIVGRSGRGRHSQVEAVWRGDPTLVAVWESLNPLSRWVRLVAEWCAPGESCGQQLLVNRHLVLWELRQLPDGYGYADAAEFVAWFHHRHASLGHPDAALECIGDLRALGVVTAGPLALTRLGRAVLEDPASVLSIVVNESTSVTVQADMTVIAPPDLRHHLVVRLDAIAVLENDSGALTYRLDAARLTRAVQAGRTPSDLVDFLAGISSTPLPDTVVRLIHDAAARAGSVRVIAAPTVVVVSDPADLVTACSIKALKLTKITDTVAVTDVPLAKVRTALERKGLTPEAVMGGGEQKARSSADDAARAAAQAAALRAASRGRADSVYADHAVVLDKRAEVTADVAARLDVRGPVTVTSTMLERLDPAGRP